MHFIGFLTGLFIFVFLIPYYLPQLLKYQKNIKNNQTIQKNDQDNHVIVSFSYIFPIAVLALLFSIIVGAQITRVIAMQGHGRFVFFSLSFPVFGFLIGYLYFKRIVRDK